MKKFFITLTTFALTILTTSTVFANSNPWSKAGIKDSGSIDSSGLFKDLDMLVGIVIALGGFIIIKAYYGRFSTIPCVA
ncbi:hypothetical protein [Ornithinibacillus scapharcae]|uniref:hypothetical protein n=1 Tax=Ornithinibacillus scapharcae TaxID=1147159 RepID=UPI000225BDDC|nr:hypothetical protein [Ornithinibacillus scapharcae]